MTGRGVHFARHVQNVGRIRRAKCTSDLRLAPAGIKVNLVNVKMSSTTKSGRERQNAAHVGIEASF